MTMYKLFVMFFFLRFSLVTYSQPICDSSGNVIIYSNYEGGNITINCDLNIPNLKIGICTYEAIEVNITGPFAGNVTGVIYAGFGGTGGCTGTTVTSITGVSPGLVTIYSYPTGNIAITPHFGAYALPLGGGIPVPVVNCMVGAGGCNTVETGGSNDSPQIVDFFLTEFGPGSVLFSHYTDYTCFGTTTFNVSSGGNCCLSSITTSINPIYAGNGGYDFFLQDTIDLCSGPVTLDLSIYPSFYFPPLWSDSTTGNTITINSPGVYSFTGWDYCHFEAANLFTDTIVVVECCTIGDISVMSTPPSCFGQSNGFATVTTSSGSSLSYLWNTTPVQTGSTATGLQAGSYIVTVTNDSLDCSKTDTVIIANPPINTFVTNNDQTIAIGDSVQLVATGEFSYTWLPAEGLSCTNCPNPFASPLTTTTYTVTGIDSLGCDYTLSVTVFVDLICGELFVPSAFSPNGDGNNDVFKVYNRCLSEVDIKIYNRWGNLEFSSTNPLESWDGKNKSKEVMQGTYFYRVKATLINGETIEKKGSINLVR